MTLKANRFFFKIGLTINTKNAMCQLYARWWLLLEHLEEILEFLKREDLNFGWGFINTPFEVPFELKPEDFMRFAKEDLEEKADRSLVNALSNIKRAIDCRIASLLCFFGLFKKAKKEDWSFPRSADFLLKTGVIAPTILKKINKKRNELEHDFKKPVYDEVTDFFDIASLFLSYTKQFIQKTYIEEFEIFAEEEHSPILRAKIDYKDEVIELNFSREKRDNVHLRIPINDEENYAKALSCIVKVIVSR